MNWFWAPQRPRFNIQQSNSRESPSLRWSKTQCLLSYPATPLAKHTRQRQVCGGLDDKSSKEAINQSLWEFSFCLFTYREPQVFVVFEISWFGQLDPPFMSRSQGLSRLSGQICRAWPLVGARTHKQRSDVKMLSNTSCRRSGDTPSPLTPTPGFTTAGLMGAEWLQELSLHSQSQLTCRVGADNPSIPRRSAVASVRSEVETPTSTREVRDKHQNVSASGPEVWNHVLPCAPCSPWPVLDLAIKNPNKKQFLEPARTRKWCKDHLKWQNYQNQMEAS